MREYFEEMIALNREIVMVGYDDEDLSLAATGDLVGAYLALDLSVGLVKEILRDRHSPKTLN